MANMAYSHNTRVKKFHGNIKIIPEFSININNTKTRVAYKTLLIKDKRIQAYYSFYYLNVIS